MKQISCPQEIAVSKSARFGTWEETLQQHVASCSVCREVLQSSLWMQSLAEEETTSGALPDPGIVWQRARFRELLRAKQAKVHAALKLMKYVEAGSLALVLFAMTRWAAWNWRLLDSAMAWLSSMTWATVYGILSATPSAFWSIIGVFSFIALTLLYPIVAID